MERGEGQARLSRALTTTALTTIAQTDPQPALTLLPFSVSLPHWLADHIVAQHQESLPDLRHIVVWSESPLAITTIQKQIAKQAKRLGHSAVLLPQFSKLSDWAFARDIPKLPTLSNASKQMILTEALRTRQGLLQTQNLWNLAKELVDLLDALSLEQVDAVADLEALQAQLVRAYRFSNETSATLSREAQIVFRLWQAWTEQSTSKLWIDPVQHYKQALTDPTLCKQGEFFYLIATNHLKACEQVFMQNLVAEQRIRLIASNDPHTPTAMNEHPAVGLAKTIRSDQVLTSDQSQYAQALAIIYSSENNLATRLEILTRHCPSNPFLERLRLCRAKNAEAHAQAVCLQVRSWRRDLIEHPITIVTNDRQLGRRIRALLEQAYIRVKDLGGWALSTTSAASVVENWLNLIEQNFPHQALLAFIKSPFFRDAHDTVLFAPLITQLEKTLSSARTTKRGIEEMITDLECVENQDPALQKNFITLLSTIDSAAKELSTHRHQREVSAKKHSRALISSLDTLGLTSSLGNDEAGALLLETLQHTHQTSTQYDIALSWKEWRQLLRETLEHHYFSPKIDHAEVTLCGFQHVDFLADQYIIIAGVEKTRLSGQTSNHLFFNNRVKAELGLANQWEQNAITYARFRQLLEHNPSILLTAESEQNGEPVELCPWVKVIDTFCNLAYQDTLSDALLEEMAHTPETYITHPQQLALPNQYERAAANTPTSLVPKKISATQYQTLMDCPYRYFGQYCLRLEAQEQAKELTSADYGQLVHRSLYAFRKPVPYCPKPFDQAIQASTRIAAIEKLSDISRAVFKQSPFAEAEKEAWWQQWSYQIPSYIDWEIKQSAQWQYAASEQKAEVALNDDFTLYGKIDRIDQKGEELALIDFKTGALSSKKQVELGEVVQLPFYRNLVPAATRAEYVTLKEPDGVKSKVLLDTEQLDEISQANKQRLHDIVRLFQEGSALTAWGEEAVCRHCDYQGLCRKQHTSTSQISE